MQLDTGEASGVRALVTGATSGIGFAIARALNEAGASVVGTTRSPERARELEGRLPGVTAVVADARDAASIEQGVAEAEQHLGGITFLVNNAGLGMRTVNPTFMTQPLPFWQVPEDGFRAVIETNLTGYFLTAKAVVPRMLASGGGRIVNVSMNHTTMNRAGFVPYGPSRAGAEALARIMAADLEGTTVTANIVLPGGATATGMLPEGAPLPAGSAILDPAVMGPPVVWLASDAASGVRNERIVATTFQEWLAAR